MILLALFGALALLAALATRGDEDLRWIGFWLVAGCILSNILHATIPVTDLPGPYSCIEFMVMLAAAVSWDSHKKCWPLLPIQGKQFIRCWPLVLLVSINILSICTNVGFAAVFPPNKRQIYVFELTTNLCFAAECLLATGVGLADGLRNDRFTYLPRFWGRIVAAYVARTRNGAR